MNSKSGDYLDGYVKNIKLWQAGIRNPYQQSSSIRMLVLDPGELDSPMRKSR